jgi:hypothetical protein
MFDILASEGSDSVEERRSVHTVQIHREKREKVFTE